MRLLPLGRGLSALDPLLADVDPALTSLGWEFGRLVLDPQYRSSPELVRRGVFLGVRHLSRHTDAHNVLACCTPMLARLYRRFGATILARKEVAGTAESLCLMHGTVAEMLRTSAPSPHAFVN